MKTSFSCYRFVVLSALLFVGCAAEPSGSAGAATGPAEGTWQGVDLNFHFENGQLTQSRLLSPLTCTGESGCKGMVTGTLTGSLGLTSPWSMAGVLQSTQGKVTIDGQFSSTKLVSGTLKAEAGTCCTVTALWTASWVPGSSPTGTGGNSAGTVKDWGAASTGTWHPAKPRAVPAQLQAPAGASAAQVQALTWLEQLRAQLGLPALPQHAQLNQAAQAHAEFYVAHAAKYQSDGLSPHSENASYGAGFTGADAGARAKAAGYGSTFIGEVMAFSGSVEGAMQGWLDTVYHRFPLINPGCAQFGYGQAAASAKTEVVDVDLGGSGTADLVVYPYPGQKGVASSWSGNEGPQPPPPPQGYPSGPVITARFGSPVQVLAHTLRNAQGQDIPHMWLDASNDSNVAMFDAKQTVIYAHQPLAAGLYTVRLDVSAAGEKRTVEWRFTVGN